MPFPLFESTEGLAHPAAAKRSIYNSLNTSEEYKEREIRRILEKWFETFPKKDNEFRGRFRNDEDDHFLGAFWELLLWRLLAVKGDVCCETAGPPNARQRKPDFRVHFENGFEFYCEATLSANSYKVEVEKRVLMALSMKLKEIPSDTWDISISLQSVGKGEEPSRKSLCHEVSKFLRKLTEQGPRPDPNDWEIECKSFESRGWQFKVIARPKALTGTKPGFVSVEDECIHKELKVDVAFSNAIEGKRPKNYPSVQGRPYVIAINSKDIFLGEKEAFECIFAGKEVIPSNPHGGAEENYTLGGLFWKKKANGQFEAREISGVIVGHQIGPWNMKNLKLCLYHNPYAEHPMDVGLVPFEERYFVNGSNPRTLKIKQAEASLSSIFEVE